MIRSLFGSETVVHALRGGLDETMDAHRAIAQRVASATTASSATSGSFAQELQKQGAGAPGAAKPLDEADLQRDMVELADTQIRFEVEARLLRGVYSALRTAVRQHA
jgi:flagellar basal body rod protein FlgB